MYFWRNWLRKIWLDKYLKTVFQRTLRKTTRQMGQQTVTISMAAPLEYLLIIAKVVALEKVPFSEKQNPKAVC